MQGGIGAPELIVIGLVVLLVPVALVVFVIVRLTAKPAANAVVAHLTSCAACGRQVSRRAKACPHCGDPT